MKGLEISSVETIKRTETGQTSVTPYSVTIVKNFLDFSLFCSPYGNGICLL